MHKKFHYIWGSLTLLLFLALAFIVQQNFRLAPMTAKYLINDTAIQKFIFGFRSSNLTTLAKLINTGFGPAGGLALAAAAIILLLIFQKKNRWLSAVYLALVMGVGTLLNTEIKKIVGRTRPVVTQLITETDKSFPSGHSIGSTLLIGGLFLVIVSQMKPLIGKILLGLLASVIILIVMASRVYLGVHYPSDTIAGMLLGVSILHLTYPTFYRLTHQPKTRHQH